MSRNSQAKKARRKKRQTARTATWMSEAEFTQSLDDEEQLDALDAAVGDIDDWLAPRGWVLDTETTENTGLVSWFYPPSAAQFDDTDLEPVTRVWIALTEDDDEVLLEFGSVLVGFGTADEPCVLDPDTLADDIAALEAYRPGMPRPLPN
jgi:hypothetical protein